MGIFILFPTLYTVQLHIESGRESVLFYLGQYMLRCHQAHSSGCKDHHFLFCLVHGMVQVETRYQEISSSLGIFYSSGLVCAFMGVVAYGAPLSALSDVVRTKSTENLAFPLCLANFVCALEWFAYGYVKGDYFIKVWLST